MAFDKDNNVVGMEQHVACGWPTEVMAPFFMPPGEDRTCPIDPFAISGADHWYSVGKHKVRAVSNDLANATFRPGLAALGRTGLHQLGARELHG